MRKTAQLVGRTQMTQTMEDMPAMEKMKHTMRAISQDALGGRPVPPEASGTWPSRSPRRAALT
jgi:hypothetical protein